MTSRPQREQGAALPTIAIMLVVLLGMAALAVDLGWLYLNANRVQKTADAAALAGVVNLPSEVGQAEMDAAGAVTANGFAPGGMIATPLPDNRLQVDLTVAVDTFFMSVFGFDTVDVARRATAQYILPVPLGSPDNCFGTDPTGAYCTGTPNFWAAISGPQTNQWNGDAYATRCIDTAGTWDCEHPNPRYRSRGYYYGIEVFPGSGPLTVRMYDAGFYERATYQTETGDTPQDGGGGLGTQFRLHEPDNTPYIPSDNTPIGPCGATIPTGAQASTYRNRWASLCTVNSPTPGIYVLQVSSFTELGGTNQYSLSATTAGGPAPRVYALNEMSVFNNVGGVATINLAEIEAVHAGKRLVIDLFDPGEDFGGNAFLSIVDPTGATASCSYTSRDDLGASGGSGSGSCRIQTSNGSPLFNGKWLTIEVDIPDGYNCLVDCWWKVRYELSNPNDRTTWAARIIGNPVRLVPNQP